MGELIELVGHVHNITSSILLKYHKGVELSESDDQVISDLYLAISEDKLESIENIPITENKHLKSLIMQKGVKKVDDVNQGAKTGTGMEAKGTVNLNLEVLNLEGKVISTGSPIYIEIAKLIEKGVPVADIHTFCIKQSNERHLTIKEAIKSAVLNSELDQKSPGAKFEAYKLAIKIESGNSDFTDEERITIKKAMEHAWGIEVVGFVWTQFNFK